MAFGIGDSLEVKITADTSDFTAGVTTAERGLDELGDESRRTAEQIEDVGDASTVAAGQVTLLNGGLSISLGLLTALVGTIGALVAGLTAVAGAAALVVGSGLAAFGERAAEANKEELETVNAKISRIEELEEITGSLTDAQEERLSSLEERRDKLEEQTSILGALKQELAPVGAAFRDAFTSAGEQFIPLVEDALNALPGLIRNLGQAFGNADLSNIISVLRGLGQFILQNAVPAFKTFLSFANDAAGSILQFRRDIIAFAQSGTGSFIRENITQVIGALKEAIDTLGPALELLQTIFTNVWDSIDSIVKPLITGLVDAFDVLITNGAEALLDVLQAIAAFVQGDFDTALSELGSALENAFAGIGGAIAELGDAIFQAVKEAIVGAVDTGIDIVTGTGDSADTTPAAPRGQFTNAPGPRRIEVQGKFEVENGELRPVIDDRAIQLFNEQERRTSEETGFNRSP
jgi:tetratricopeptide (TPR) repeat protein